MILKMISKLSYKKEVAMRQIITDSQAYTNFWLGIDIFYQDFGITYTVSSYAELANLIDDCFELFILV